MKYYQNTWETTHSKPNVCQTNVIIMFCIEMLLEPLENNTFQPQSVRIQYNNTNVNFHMLNMYYLIRFWHFSIEMHGFPLVLNTSPYRTLLLHWFGTRWVFNVLFSLCSDNMSCRHVAKTTGKQYVPNSMYCFLYVLITCLHEMLSEH